jgi:uncharacterized SAM-binding protein YcdF (DUF218 family)
MFVFLSKLLPLFIYPLGLACIALLASLAVRGKNRLTIGLVAGALVLLWLGGTNWVSTALTRSLEWRYLPGDQTPTGDVIVVLGGGTSAPQFPRQMVEMNDAIDRVFYAAWLYQQGAAPRLFLTGGNIEWRDQRETTPAEEMASVLAMLGVPQEALWLELESRNTYENAVYTTQTMRAEGIEQVILVTSALHMPRSVALYRKLGWDVTPAPTDYAVTEQIWEDLWRPDLANQLFNFLPTARNLSQTTNALKEYLGLFVYGLRGWI